MRKIHGQQGISGVDVVDAVFSYTLGGTFAFLLHYSMQKNFNWDHPPCNRMQFG